MNSKNLIEEYYETIKDQYPHLSLQDVTKICKEPFFYTRRNIESNDLPEIRLQYLGKFVVYPNRAKAMLKYSKISLEKGSITQERFDEIEQNINSYLLAYEKD